MGARSNLLKVTVAATENGLHIFDMPDGEAPPGASWSQMPRTTISAKASESLREVLTRAALELNISVSLQTTEAIADFRAERGEPPVEEGVVDRLAFAQFRRLDDDERNARGTLKRYARLNDTAVAVVRDDQRRAVWKRPPFDATMAELIDAAEAGLVDGDPLQPYLVLVIPQGELGGLAEWHQFADQLKLLWQISGFLAQAGGVWGFIELVRKVASRRSEESARVIEQNARAWAERGARPSDILKLVASRPRSSVEIAGLLGCSTGEAEAVLWALGCSKEGQLWVHRGDAAAAFIADDLALAEVLAMYGGKGNLGAEFERRLSELGEDGIARSADDEKLRMHKEFSREVETEFEQESESP